MADKRLKKVPDYRTPEGDRVPFRDARGDIWIYHRHEEIQQKPMGPFFTAEYAMAASKLHRGSETLLVLTRRQPKPPFTPIKPRGARA
jgi:hypothetical protein